MQKIPAPRRDPMIPEDAPQSAMSRNCMHGDVQIGYYEVDFWDDRFGLSREDQMVAVLAVIIPWSVN